MKAARQAEILKLIREYEIGTQEELCEKLNGAGYAVTQATVSRDIRELKLTKISSEDGRQRYVSFRESAEDMEEKFVRVFREGFVSMDRAQNILVIRTVAGMAMAVAAALDAMHFPEAAGCIAGDDTIFCAMRSEEDTGKLTEKLKNMLQEAEPGGG